LTKPTQFKIGIVNVREGKTPTKGEAFFEMRYIDPPTGREVRRRVSGLSHEKVCEMAANLTVEAYEGRGYLKARPKAPTLEQGLMEAVRLSRGNDMSKAAASRDGEKFLAFMARRYPAAKTWGDVRSGMIESFVRELEGRGLAFDSVRLALAPIKAAWRRMFADYPELVKPLARITQAPRPRREIQCFDAPEVAALLGWLKENQPALWGMACVQALAGLRVLEAAALRIQDVDFGAATVTITDTGRHKPKTVASERTIPVCTEIMAALRETAAGQHVRPVSGEVFVNAKGDPWNRPALGRRWTFALRRAARDLGLPRLAAVPSRKLRAAFATMAGRLGASDRIVATYMGHKARDILGNHYQRIGPDELASVSERFETWRETLIEAPRRKDSGNIRRAVLANG